MPHILINKLNRLMSQLPNVKGQEGKVLQSNTVELSEDILNLIDDIEKTARNTFGHNPPSPRQLDIMTDHGFPVKLLPSESLGGKVATIITKHGKITYR